jgi:MFS-type transporter involved in bile tolerance (Atg22 family)
MLFRPINPRLIRLLYLEIMWSSILGGITAFNAAYVVRLGATSTEVSLMSALPALSAIFISIPAGRFIQTRAHPERWTLVMLALHWTGCLMLALVPWLHLGFLSPAQTAVLSLVLFAVPAHVFNVGIHPLMMEVVPEQHRIRVFAVRSLINSTVVSITTLIGGQWLSRVGFPGNYQVAYVVAWLAAMICVAHWIPIAQANRAAAIQHPTAPPLPRPTGKGGWRHWLADLRQYPDFSRIVRNSLFHSIGLWVAGPLYILHYVRELGATDAWVGLLSTVTAVSTVIGLLFWRVAAERLRESKTLRITILSAGVFPLMVGISPNLTLILVAAVFNGFFAAGINISHINVLLKTLPDAKRSEYMGVWSTIMNVGAFVCPLLGVPLANWIGVAPVLAICGVVTILGSATHSIWPVGGRTVKALPAPKQDRQPV